MEEVLVPSESEMLLILEKQVLGLQHEVARYSAKFSEQEKRIFALEKAVERLERGRIDSQERSAKWMMK